MEIYFDRFAGEYTTEKSVTAPPERYIQIFRGLDDSCWLEHWFCTDGIAREGDLGIGYANDKYENESLDMLRKFHADKNKVKLVYLKSVTYPAKLYDERFKDILDEKDYSTRGENNAKNKNT